jgi:polyhydroxyalkanoate synthesis repressor PhaR
MSTARVIKKYRNRRLYDTEESRYITLADIRNLVLCGIDLVVVDKKSGDDITRSILLQVIRDQEQNGEAILSEGFLSQVIRCYGQVAPGSMARYLEQSLRHFLAQPQNLSNNEVVGTIADQTKNTLTSGP